MSVDILGVKIDDISLDQATDQITEWLREDKKHYIVTPNPEFIVVALDDGEFKKILNEADLAIPDGVGLKLTGKIRHNTPGVDLMEKLCQVAADLGFTVGLLGSKHHVAKKAAECLLESHPKLKITFAEEGSGVNERGELVADLIYPEPMLTIPPTDILFVAFGMVKQEKWIYKNFKKLPIRLAVGVGGALDYISKTVPRAPFWVRKVGLEWLFRLLVQPWRIKRQLALVKFLILVLTKSK